MNFFPLFCFFLPISVQVFMYDCLCLVTTACMFVKARSWHQVFPLAAYHFIAVESLASLASLTHSLVLVTSCYCLPVVGGPPNWSNLWEDAEDTDSSHHVWVARALWILCTELYPQPPQVLSCSSLYKNFMLFTNTCLGGLICLAQVEEHETMEWCLSSNKLDSTFF